MDYVYKANSNELLKVTDNLETSPSGFNDRANNAEEYGYDLHGNMTRDDNKGITDIRYNHLNLPIKITFGTQGEIAYVYNAEGKKLEKTVTQTGSTAVTTKYLDGFQYVDNVLQFFPHAEGYVKKNGNNYNYVFNYTDHLGNVRLSYSDLDKDGVLEQDERILTVATDGSGNATELFVSCIIEENNYYPFGLKHSGYNEGGFQASKNKVKFNGKEYQDELGLNWYDYHARSYMSDLARTTTHDPHAQNYYSLSSYSFLNNNPIVFIDPNGKDIYRYDDKTGALVRMAETGDDFDQIGDYKYNNKTKEYTLKVNKKDGTAKTKIDKITKGILKDGINFKENNNVIEVNGEGQPTEQNVIDFLVAYSDNVAKVEVSGYGLNDKPAEEGTSAMLVWKHKGNRENHAEDNPYNKNTPIRSYHLGGYTGKSRYAKYHYHTHLKGTQYNNAYGRGSLNESSGFDNIRAITYPNLPHMIFNINGEYPIKIN